MTLRTPTTRQKILSIGNICVGLKVPDPAFWQIADQRYSNFYDTNGKRPKELLEVCDGTLRRLSQGMTPDLVPKVFESNGTVRMAWENSVAEWDRRRHLCRIRQPRSKSRFPDRYASYICDSFMRIMLSFLLIERGGFLIHAAGLIRKGKGYLFVGKSGAGKSTVTRLSADSSTALSDDLTVGCLTKNGGEIFGTPFFGTQGVPGPNQSAPLTGIYFLCKAPSNKVLRVSRQDAVRNLLQSVMFFGQSKTAGQAVLDLAISFCDRIPCYDLHFLPDPSFWRCIDDRKDHFTERKGGLSSY